MLELDTSVLELDTSTLELDSPMLVPEDELDDGAGHAGQLACLGHVA